MAEPTRFNALVEILTITHTTTLPEDCRPYNTRTGKQTKTVKTEGLLTQLQTATTPTNRKNGGTGNKLQLPVDAGAVDLLRQLTKEINQAWQDVNPQTTHNPHNAPQTTLRQWAATQPDTNDTFNGYRTDDWLRSMVQRITEYLDPQRTADLNGTCINCDTAKITTNKNGETIQETALYFLLDRNTGEIQELRCRSCNKHWGRTQLEEIAHQMENLQYPPA